MSRPVLRKIYDLIPFKKGIFSVIKTVIKPPRKWYPYLYVKGIISFRVNEKKVVRMMDYGFRFHVENSIFWGGLDDGWERVSVGLWRRLCEEEAVVFDIGANTGLYSLLAKAINEKSEVIAFEPLEGVMKKLKYNIELNGMDITCSDLALSNYTGTAQVFPESLDHVYSVTVNKRIGSPEKQVFEQTIPVVRMDEFIEKHSIKSIGLMKIDVETHEVEVLEGMGKYLAQFRPDLLIEIQSNEIAEGVMRLIKDLNYEFYNIDENKGINKTDRLYQSHYFNYLVCKPETARRLGLS